MSFGIGAASRKILIPLGKRWSVPLKNEAVPKSLCEQAFDARNMSNPTTLASNDSGLVRNRIMPDTIMTTVKAPFELRRGERIGAGGPCYLTMQWDGNLVFYGQVGTQEENSTKAIWSSNTVGSTATLCAFQEDGNLVLYTDEHVAKWSSDTIVPVGAVAWLIVNPGIDMLNPYVFISIDGIIVWRRGYSPTSD